MVETIINGIIFILSKLGYAGIFLGMFLESACIPIPSEVVLPFGGFLVSTGDLELILTMIVATAAGTMGSISMYYLGRLGGRPLVEKYAEKLRLSRSHIEKSDMYFQKYGERIVFFSRILPIIRTFISLPAGLSKMDFKKFTIYTIIGSAIWSVILVYAGYVMGQNWVVIRSWFHILDILFIIVVICFAGYILFKKFRRSSENA